MLNGLMHEMQRQIEERKVQLNNIEFELRDLNDRYNSLVEHNSADEQKLEHLRKLIDEQKEHKRIHRVAIDEMLDSVEYYRYRIVSVGGVDTDVYVQPTKYKSLLDWCDEEEKRGMTMERAAASAKRCKHPQPKKKTKRVFTTKTARELWALPESRWFPGEVGIISMSRTPVAVVSFIMPEMFGAVSRFTKKKDEEEAAMAREWLKKRRSSHD